MRRAVAGGKGAAAATVAEGGAAVAAEELRRGQLRRADSCGGAPVVAAKGQWRLSDTSSGGGGEVSGQRRGGPACRRCPSLPLLRAQQPPLPLPPSAPTLAPAVAAPSLRSEPNSRRRRRSLPPLRARQSPPTPLLPLSASSTAAAADATPSSRVPTPLLPPCAEAAARSLLERPPLRSIGARPSPPPPPLPPASSTAALAVSGDKKLGRGEDWDGDRDIGPSVTLPLRSPSLCIMAVMTTVWHGDDRGIKAATMVAGVQAMAQKYSWYIMVTEFIRKRMDTPL
uniref:Uncharacterized protein n=1 Tax=Oryza sativa subsp. japonica TaxID=39947 RepID=Q6Z6Q4_ORYSJ|nr:hypothetical protein [Oryza sativa Japonica Group]